MLRSAGCREPRSLRALLLVSAGCTVGVPIGPTAPDPPSSEPNEPTKGWLATQAPGAALMIVQDLSGSMSVEGASTLMPVDWARRGHLAFMNALVDRVEAPQLGIVVFAEWSTSDDGARVTTFDGPKSVYADPAPATWARLTPLGTAAGIEQLERRIATVCSPAWGCGDDPVTGTTPDLVGPSIDTIGTCTNPEVGIRHAARELVEATEPGAFRAIVLVTDGLANCGGEGAGALEAAQMAYAQHAIQLWVVGSGAAIHADTLYALPQGIGTFTEVADVARLPAALVDLVTTPP